MAGGPASAFPEHPRIKPLPDSVLMDVFCEHSRLAKAEIKGAGTVQGEYWYLYYQIWGMDKNVDDSVKAGEILAHFQDYAQQNGAAVLLQDEENLTFKEDRGPGRATWCHVKADDGAYWMTLIDENAYDPRQIIGHDQIADLLRSEAGKAILFNVAFTPHEALLMPGAEKALAQLALCLRGNLDLSVTINAHVHEVKDAARALVLSEKRALTVKQYLLLFGISPGRIYTQGMGSLQRLEEAPEDEKDLHSRIEVLHGDARLVK